MPSPEKKAGAGLTVLSAMLSLFVTAPIWMVLMYRVLVAIEAGTLEWVLYCIYVPFCIFSVLVSMVAKILLGDE